MHSNKTINVYDIDSKNFYTFSNFPNPYSFFGSYKLTEDVKDFLEPLVDAEYFKLRYRTSTHEPLLYKAMEQLKTQIFNQLIKNTES